jgi:hypothetical protein
MVNAMDLDSWVWLDLPKYGDYFAGSDMGKDESRDTGIGRVIEDDDEKLMEMNMR